MITNEVKNDLEKKFGYVVKTFGGVDNYLKVINLKLGIPENATRSNTTKAEYQKVLLEIYKLLSHNGTVTVVSPWNSVFKLFDVSAGGYAADSIVLDEPYTILNDKGQELYSVSGHQGVFGNSTLDRVLLLQSNNGDIYYLHYLSHDGNYKTRLLLINYISLVTTSTTNQAVAPVVTEVEQNELNQIVFSYSSSTDTNTYINLYFVSGAPVRIPRKEAVKNNPYSQITTQSAVNSNTIIFNPNKSGWLVATKTRGSTEQFMKITNITGAGTNKFLSATEDQYIYYVLGGTEVDLNTVKQVLGIRGIENNAVGIAINIRASLVAD